MEGQKIPNHIPTPATESIRVAIDDLQAAMQQDTAENPQRRIVTSNEALSVNSTPPNVKGLFTQALGYFSGSAARKPSIAEFFAQAHSAPAQKSQSAEKRVRFSEKEMLSSPQMRAPPRGNETQIVDEGDEIIFHHTPEGKPVEPPLDPIANLQERMLSRSNVSVEIPEEIPQVEAVVALTGDMALISSPMASDHSDRVNDGLDLIDDDDTDGDQESLSDLKEGHIPQQGQSSEVSVDVEDFNTPITSPLNDLPEETIEDESLSAVQYLYWISKGQEELVAKVDYLNEKFDAVTSKQNEVLTGIFQAQKLILDTIKQDWAAPVRQYDNLKHTINEMDQKISALRTEVKATCGGIPKLESQLGDISRMLASFEISMIREQIINTKSGGLARTASYLHTPDEFGQSELGSQQLAPAPSTSAAAGRTTSSGLNPLNISHESSMPSVGNPAIQPKKITSADIAKVLGDPLVKGKPSAIFKAWAKGETKLDLKQLFPKISLRMEKALKAEKAKGEGQDYSRFFIPQ
ncbi:MAG: hypothetical protein [brine shrimp arlivirus 2]|nr:MAG: hypothetical protein [brine shrimp arlivirus 2]